MQILVLGGTGFIGSHLVPRLLADDHCVTVLNRGKSKSDSAVVSLQADRDDAAAMQQALERYDGSEFEAVIDTSSVCLRHTQVLLAQLPQFAGHLIHISSASVYLHCQMAKESDPIGGASVWGDYGVDKSEVDRFCSMS